MHPFWRTQPLSQQEIELIDRIGQAHYRSTFRQNPSTVALQCAAQGCGDLFRSVAAALVTFGGGHGPLEATYDLLVSSDDPVKLVNAALSEKRRIPGWGSSFSDGSAIDPDWQPVDECLRNNFIEHHRKLTAVTAALHAQGKMILPNPSAFTATAAIITGMPRRLTPYLLIMSRLQAWTEIFLNELKGA